MNKFLKVNIIKNQRIKVVPKEIQTNFETNKSISILNNSKINTREFGREIKNNSVNLTVVPNGVLKKNNNGTTGNINKICCGKRIDRKIILQVNKMNNLNQKQKDKIYQRDKNENKENIPQNNQNIQITQPFQQPQQHQANQSIQKSPREKSKRESNPQLVEEYFDEIYEYTKSIECNNLPRKDYMLQIQNDLCPKMRCILIDWLISVHLKFNLRPETLYLTINIIDRYLSEKSIKRGNFQLLGVTAMIIACKYEEIYFPDISQFVYLTDGACNKKQVVKLEYDVLTTLHFNITNPSPLRFAEFYKKIFYLNEREFYLVQYILELCGLDYKFCAWKPSVIANCAVYEVLNMRKSNDIIQKNFFNVVGIKREDFWENIKEVHSMLVNSEKSQYTAIKKKYSGEKFMGVAKGREWYKMNDVLVFSE